MVGLKRTKNDIVTEQVKEVLTSTNLLEVSCKLVGGVIIGCGLFPHSYLPTRWNPSIN